MIGELKMFIARQLDRLPWTCWAELAAWAMGYSTFRDAMKTRCDPPFPCCGCWCGKNLNRDTPKEAG